METQPHSLKRPAPEEVEAVYDRILYVIDMLDQHSWGRRIPDRDARFVNLIRNELVSISNDTYKACHEVPR
jgi:hypothetical protein